MCSNHSFKNFAIISNEGDEIMKQLLLLIFILFNAWSAFDIYANYSADELIDWLSIRIILLVVSGALSVIYILLGSKKLTNILAVINIVLALTHFYRILLIYFN